MNLDVSWPINSFSMKSSMLTATNKKNIFFKCNAFELIQCKCEILYFLMASWKFPVFNIFCFKPKANSYYKNVCMIEGYIMMQCWAHMSACIAREREQV